MNINELLADDDSVPVESAPTAQMVDRSYVEDAVRFYGQFSHTQPDFVPAAAGHPKYDRLYAWAASLTYIRIPNPEILIRG